jgi:lipopolysaccharide/colanic/teichoic acid biosynthesis glycosyltransferase
MKEGFMLDVQFAKSQQNPVEAAVEITNSVPKIIGDRFYSKYIKRAFDFTAVMVTAPAWMFLVGTLSFLIKINDWHAPVFFTQLRTGKNGQRFPIYKFRTMASNAEDLKKELMHLNELEWPDFKITNDPRITRIGNFLRRTSLDELPQLINVLQGDMTLVGPRPTSFDSDTYQVWQTERLDIKPGLTGLWQIVARADVLFDERVRMEIAYVNNCSLGLDWYILANTLISLVKTKGV